MRWITIILSLLLLSACANKAELAYQQGNEAFAVHHYNTAFAHYLYAAHQGVTPAQYAVAYQYYYGLGTALNETKALNWLHRAAKRSSEARYALILLQAASPKMPWTLCYKTSPRTHCHW